MTNIQTIMKTLGRAALALMLAITAAASAAVMAPVEDAWAGPAERFLDQVGEDARIIAQDHDIYASVMLAQAIMESGSGTSGLSKAPNYNLFGVKGRGEAGSVTMATSEWVDGGYIGIDSAFRKYYDWSGSMYDYAQLISQYYSSATKSRADSYSAAASAIQRGGYASSPEYAAHICSTICMYHLDQYDTPLPYYINGDNPARMFTLGRTHNGDTISMTDIWNEAAPSVQITDVDEDNGFHAIDPSVDLRIGDVVTLHDGTMALHLGAGHLGTVDADGVFHRDQATLDTGVAQVMRHQTSMDDAEKHAAHVANTEQELHQAMDQVIHTHSQQIENLTTNVRWHVLDHQGGDADES